jgi:hypothetical protein
MTTVVLKAPTGTQGTVLGPAGTTVTVGSDGTATVDVSLVNALLGGGWTYASNRSAMAMFLLPPVPTGLTAIVAATIPVSGTPYTIAAQPAYACKLNVRIVQSGAVASLVLNIVGTDGRGNAITESVNVAGASTQTIVTANAFAKVTSATPVGTVTNVTTLGIGEGAALALPLPPAFVDLVVYKQMRMTGAAGVIATPVDEAVGTVDTVAGTVSPGGTAANGTTLSFMFYYTWTSSP